MLYCEAIQKLDGSWQACGIIKSDGGEYIASITVFGNSKAQVMRDLENDGWACQHEIKWKENK